MPEVRELAEALCDALAAFEPGRYSGADCVALTELLSRTANCCQVASARAATTVAESGAYREHGFTSPVDWLARAAGSSVRARARAALNTMAAVKDCPTGTRDALVAGKVSLAQAAEITTMPEDEAELLEIAMRSSLGALREEARTRWQAAIPPDTLHAAPARSWEFMHWKNRLGMTCFRGALPPEVGVPFAKRMDAETDRVWHAAASREPRGHSGAVRRRRVRATRQRPGQEREPLRRHGDRRRPAPRTAAVTPIPAMSPTSSVAVRSRSPFRVSWRRTRS